MKFLLDTDHISILQRGCHSYIIQAKTAADVIRGYKMFDRVLSAFAAALVLPFDAKASAAFDSLVAQRVRIATMDLRIAAIALSERLTLVTRNSRDFGKVPGLILEDWTI
jgi:tRNA(fMet)-specific endonuclease VapC